METIKGLERLLSRLNNIGNIDLEDTMKKATTLVHARAKELAPKDTGNLRASIHMETKKLTKTIEGRVFTNVQYAPYVEFGTGSTGNGSYPYKIDGLNLSYRDTPWVYTPDGGETFYRTNGQVAQPYMYPALKRNEKTIKAMFKEGVHTKLKSNCKGGK